MIHYDGGLTCSLGVSDMARSIAWYRDVLGFSLLYQMEDIAWCELSTGVAKVSLGLGQVEEVKNKGGITPTFGVQDIAAAKAVLDKAGVPQDGEIRDIPGIVRLLTFFDPDGHSLMFYQDISGAAA